MPMPTNAQRSILPRAPTLTSTAGKAFHVSERGWPRALARASLGLPYQKWIGTARTRWTTVPLHPFRSGIDHDQAAPRLAEFVERLRAGPRAGLLALRALAISLGPDVVERVDSSAVTYLRRDHAFLVIESARTRLFATFPADIHLDDPMGRLLKRGEHHYFRVDDAGDLDAHVQQFVQQAYSAARST